MTDSDNILFFSRANYGKIFSRLKFDRYRPFHVTVNLYEKNIVEKQGHKVVACFEEEFDHLKVSPIPDNFLKSSYQSDRFLGWLSLSERIEILGKSITFWRNIFQERRYIAGIHETIAIEQEEVFSLIMKEFNIMDLSLLCSAMPGYFFFKPSPYHSGFPIEKLQSATPDETMKKSAYDHIHGLKKKGHKPFWVERLPNRMNYSRKRLFLSLFKHELKKIFGLYQFPAYENRKNDSLFYYNKRRTNNDFYEQKFVHYFTSVSRYDAVDEFAKFKKYLFPFHFEPEATLLYFNPAYAEQINVIQQIAKQLPHNAVLFVKEHPSQPGYLMRKEYQDLRKRNSNIAILPGELDSHALINVMDAVITICGSVGWEAVVNNKPVIVLGNVFYDKHPDVYKPQKFADIKTYLLSDKLIQPDDERTIDFFSRFLSYNYKGNPSDLRLYRDRNNLENISKAVESEIDKRKRAANNNHS